MKRSMIAGLGGLLGLALSWPAPSQACLHEVVFSKDDAVAAVARADRMLADGRAESAYNTSRRARHRLEQAAREGGSDLATEALIERARRITAVAVVRLDGRTPLSARTARRHVLRGRQERSLGWALEQLRTWSEAHPDDLRSRVHYAEALARLPPHRAEARAILTRLAERDLMPDANGYATLLRLSEPGSEAWHAALTRCHRMAGDNASRICPSASSPGS